MRKDKKISMTETKDRLNHLNTFMPQAKDEVYSFGKILSDKLGKRASPVEFIRYARAAASQAELKYLEDTEKRLNLKPNTLPFSNCSLGNDSYSKYQISEIARATCPADFAEKVSAVYDENLRQVSREIGRLSFSDRLSLEATLFA